MGVTVVLVQEQALCHKGVVCGGLVSQAESALEKLFR